uniref:Non-specific serine/threonine protein kinase (EC) n=1 Tax=Ganoderma boninense TaxID=34458 RepID=A0A5K1K8M8_9APHY|nr:Non-specific serine/threonine protein kinase (EC [Ganoderma boninense]
MDHIDKVLTNASLSSKYVKPIHVTCGLVKKALNKYYSYTDMSDTYRIIIMLHPSHKLDYFKKIKWDDDWQKNVKELLLEEFEWLYVPAGDPEHDEDAEDPPSDSEGGSGRSYASPSGMNNSSDDELDVSEVHRAALLTIRRGVLIPTLSIQDENIFDALKSITHLHVLQNAGHELKCFLAIPVEHMDDPLLCIPAMSMDVERVFSKGCLLLSHVRSRMSAHTTCAVLCLGAWSRAGYVKGINLQKAALAADLDSKDDEFKLT